MINFDDVIKENMEEHNANWPQIPHYPYRILTNGVSGHGKKKSLFHLINDQLDISKVYLCTTNPYEVEHTGLKHLMILKLLLNTQMKWMIFNTTQIKKNAILIIFDYMIADILSNKQLIPIVTGLE